MGFWAEFFIILIIPLNKFVYNNVNIVCAIEKLYYIYYIIGKR